MGINTHFYCDQCESILNVEQEVEVYEGGWLVLSFGPAEEAYYFCSLPCASRWTSDESSLAIVEKAVRPDED